MNIDIDLDLLDINLPDKDGEDLIEKLTKINLALFLRNFKTVRVNMLSDKGFDLWADDYDESVEISDENNSYPFAGYKIILNKIYNEILRSYCKNILDIGFSTGTLIFELYEHGYKIFGQDFSDRMLKISNEKMPKAQLFIGDISNGLVDQLLEYKYDAIIATYSLHHLSDF